MEKLSSDNINLQMKMRFIGYYMKDDQFMQTEEGIDAMFEREPRSRVRFNCCLAQGNAIPTG